MQINTMVFEGLEEGARFKTTKIVENPKHPGKNGMKYLELKKINRKDSICVGQHGYGSNAMIGTFTQHTSAQIVFKV